MSEETNERIIGTPTENPDVRLADGIPIIRRNNKNFRFANFSEDFMEPRTREFTRHRRVFQEPITMVQADIDKAEAKKYQREVCFLPYLHLLSEEDAGLSRHDRKMKLGQKLLDEFNEGLMRKEYGEKGGMVYMLYKYGFNDILASPSKSQFMINPMVCIYFIAEELVDYVY